MYNKQQTMKAKYLKFNLFDNVLLNESYLTEEGTHMDAGTQLIVIGFIRLYKKKHKYAIRVIQQNGVCAIIPHTLLVKNRMGWKITDSDCNQWGRMVSPQRKRKAPHLFHFSELRWNGTENELYESTIDLSKYIHAEMESDINSFGYTLYDPKDGLLNVHTEYGKDAHWIIAECIFELES